MSTPRILLLGKNGQVGWELQRSLAPLGQLVALDRAGLSAQAADAMGLGSVGPLCGDLNDLEGLARTVQVLHPQIIVNAAAYTAVDQAETDVDNARRLNAEAPGALAQAAHAIGAWLVHYSTDYVFNGQGHLPWTEDAAPEPLNVYGHTKLDGERRIVQAGRQHLILRTSWVYAARGGNFARTMLRLAQERERLAVIDDQVGAPTGADLIADVTAHAVRQLWHTGEGAGTYHLAAASETSWHGYAQHVIDTARRWQPERPWRVQTVDAIPSSAYPVPARRPLNSRLDTRRLQQAFGLHLPPWQAGVNRLLAEIL